MRSFSLVLLTAALPLMLPACAQKATAPKTTKAATSQPKAAGPVLTYERTACFGTCPTYRASVFADGRVAYEGVRFVPTAGKKDLTLPAATVADMQRMAQELSFANLPAEYVSGATDMPSTIVAVQQADGKLKTVRVEGTRDVPMELQNFLTYLKSQFDPLAGIVATSDK